MRVVPLAPTPTQAPEARRRPLQIHVPRASCRAWGMLRVEGREGSEIKTMDGKSKVEEEAGLAHGSLAVHPGRAVRLSHACAGRLASPAPRAHSWMEEQVGRHLCKMACSPLVHL